MESDKGIQCKLSRGSSRLALALCHKANHKLDALPYQAAGEKFMKAQKPWAKTLKEMKRCRKSYYSACTVLKHLESKVATMRRGKPCCDVAVQVKIHHL